MIVPSETEQLGARHTSAQQINKVKELWKTNPINLRAVVGLGGWLPGETVKFGHITFFWNGNRSGYFNSELEEYVEIPSDSSITFNVQPKMKALEIGEKTRDAILSGKFDQVQVNVAAARELSQGQINEQSLTEVEEILKSV
ncbi:phosphoglycerate mutase, 2,3-bisphosphoglycerate-independent [Artemisia annua]|uniref:Phosphoglycerate mutase, 2,3-bisphosphoglycerate-independent n=1 Tax=Artemisia annua TaxID=35608 RepID=A0A2U1LLN4_ARTAN|nr:phosphoglycerate mutase, 2,3-bisphosphoglycerate-independent [Artemisia annua]